VAILEKMNFHFYTNAISQASRKVASGIFIVGLVLVGFGVIILALPAIFAFLAAAVFFIAGLGCAITAVKIFLAQRKMNKINNDNIGDDSQSYRKNVQIHIEENYDR
jgi:uncharacterized membrane protein